MPGPACFNRGGTEPTVTDADVVLGYINPQYYYGGKLNLNKEKAIAGDSRQDCQAAGHERGRGGGHASARLSTATCRRPS